MYKTKRLILKILDGDYNSEVAEYYLRNNEFLRLWEPERRDMFYTSQFQKIQLTKDLNDIKSGKLIRLWIFKKDKEQKLIGNISFTNIIRGNFLSCHLGYKLDKDETNKGYITEAIEKGIKIMFEEHKLHRVEANIMPSNKASLRVVEKLSFLNEGISKKYLKINGKWEDHINMVLLNENIV